MRLLNWLFGKKVTIQFRDSEGELVNKRISESELHKLETSGAISKGRIVEVHVLDPNGNYTTHYEIGKDVPAAIVAKFADPKSGVLYAVTVYREGKPTTQIVMKEQWLGIQAKFDAIESEANVESRIDQFYDQFEEPEPEVQGLSNGSARTTYVNEDLAYKEYELVGASGSQMMNAMVFTLMLLNLRSSGWSGAEEMFQSDGSSGDVMKSLQGDYEIGARDAAEIAAFIKKLLESPGANDALRAPVNPLFNVASQGKFTVRT